MQWVTSKVGWEERPSNIYNFLKSDLKITFSYSINLFLDMNLHEKKISLFASSWAWAL